MPAKKPDLSEEEIADYKEAFGIFDRSGNGQITLADMQAVMSTMHQNPPEEELAEMIRSVDESGDGTIGFQEFVVLMQRRVARHKGGFDKMLKDAFQTFDEDGNGTISREELKLLMSRLSQNLSEAELDAMMDEIDTDGDGVISFEEFQLMMRS